MAVLANSKVDLGDPIDALAVSDVDQESGLGAAACGKGSCSRIERRLANSPSSGCSITPSSGKGGEHGASHQFGRALAAATGRGAVVKALDDGDLGVGEQWAE